MNMQLSSNATTHMYCVKVQKEHAAVVVLMLMVEQAAVVVVVFMVEQAAVVVMVVICDAREKYFCVMEVEWGYVVKNHQSWMIQSLSYINHVSVVVVVQELNTSWLTEYQLCQDP